MNGDQFYSSAADRWSVGCRRNSLALGRPTQRCSAGMCIAAYFGQRERENNPCPANDDSLVMTTSNSTIVTDSQKLNDL